MQRDSDGHLYWQPTMLPLAGLLSSVLWTLMFWALPLSTMMALVAAALLACSAIALQPAATRALAAGLSDYRASISRDG